MAKKKTISISRKPSADTADRIELDPVVSSHSMALVADLKPRPDGVFDTPNTPSSPSVYAYGPIGLAIYGPVFCLSYSLVFSAILLSKFLPYSGLVRQGVYDGANAAQRGLNPRTDPAD